MELRDRLYPEYARVAQAFASDRRFRIVELLAQAPRTVDTIARLADMSVANASQHLQLLRRAGLVIAEKQGVSVWYRLASDDVMRLWLGIQAVAGTRLGQVRAAIHECRGPAGRDPVSRDDLERLIATGKAIVLDVRPRAEFEHGHLANALGIPLDEMLERVAEIPPGLPIVAYCRGLACEMADRAVAILRQHGRDAYCLDGGWPEWRVENRPVEMASSLSL